MSVESGPVPLEQALALAGFASIEEFVTWSESADLTALQATGLWLAALTTGGGE